MPIFKGFASFNGEEPDYLLSNGTKVHPTQYSAYGSDYAAGRAQILGDYTYLGQQGVKMIRIWPVLSTFYYYNGAWQPTPNAYISNLDEVLSTLATAGVQAYLVLLSTPTDGSTDQCVTNANYYLTPALVQNTGGAQDAYIAALSNFITRYASNTTIVAYDVINELNSIVNGIVSGHNVCSEVWDTSGTSFTQIKALLARIVSTIKGVDSIHQMTFSCVAIQAMGTTAQTLLAPYVDYYDFHVYLTNNNVDAYYANFSTQYGTYDKPVMQGEVGINSTIIDPGTGLSCDPDRWCVAPLMSSYCQTYWLTNAQKFFQGAKNSGQIAHIFFSYWPDFRWFGIRTDDGSHTWLGHQLSSAGATVFNLATSDRSSIASTDTFVRSNQSGWGTASDGEVWTQVSGTATPSIATNEGLLVNVTSGTNIMILGGNIVTDADIKVRLSVSGSTNDKFGLIARYNATTNTYYLLRFSGTGLLQIQSVVNGVATNLAAASFILATNTFYWLSFTVWGSFLGGSMWADGSNVPVNFMAVIHDTSITAAGEYGILYTPASIGGETLKVDHFSVSGQNPYPATLFPTFTRRDGIFPTLKRRG